MAKSGPGALGRTRKGGRNFHSIFSTCQTARTQEGCTKTLIFAPNLPRNPRTLRHTGCTGRWAPSGTTFHTTTDTANCRIFNTQKDPLTHYFFLPFDSRSRASVAAFCFCLGWRKISL
uniref:(northern house mosquito) hypothetical protein n=1 Tax=Culex pipiens TaxID=7175 RepID=A0A8D8B0L7_CULPI